MANDNFVDSLFFLYYTLRSFIIHLNKFFIDHLALSIERNSIKHFMEILQYDEKLKSINGNINKIVIS